MELIQCSPLVLQMLERLGQLPSESLAELGANPGHTVSSPVLSTTHQVASPYHFKFLSQFPEINFKTKIRLGNVKHLCAFSLEESLDSANSKTSKCPDTVGAVRRASAGQRTPAPAIFPGAVIELNGFLGTSCFAHPVAYM